MIREIAREEWAAFFEAFTLQHDGWLVRVDGTDGTLEESPFEGIAARDSSIVVTCGHDSPLHRRIVIPAPRRVVINTTGGSDYGVAIEDARGVLTRVRLRTPVPVG